jgi:hypothetical protein
MRQIMDTLHEKQNAVWEYFADSYSIHESTCVAIKMRHLSASQVLHLCTSPILLGQYLLFFHFTILHTLSPHYILQVFNYIYFILVG